MSRKLWIILGSAAAVGLLLWTSACGSLVASLFGPPAVEGKEQYAKDGKIHFDHSRFDRLLREHVSTDGLVDYPAFQKDRKELQLYLQDLAAADFEALGRDEKLALLINGYNAFTIELILEHYPLASIRDIPASDRWKKKRWRLGKLTLSLDEIEHAYLRKRFAEPRIHFAIVCASIGCPPLRAEAYRASGISEQLESQVRRVHRDGRWYRSDEKGIHLTRLYSWFAGDFERAAGSVLRFVARYDESLRERLKSEQPTIHWLPYSWKLNDAKR